MQCLGMSLTPAELHRRTQIPAEAGAGGSGRALQGDEATLWALQWAGMDLGPAWHKDPGCAALAHQHQLCACPRADSQLERHMLRLL